MEVLKAVGVSNAGVRSSMTGLNSGFRSPRPPTHLAPYRQALDFAIKPGTLHQATFRRPLCITADLKRWERKEVKENSLPVTQTLHVKVGDTVQVISGAEKKKVGEVLRIFTHDSRILVKNVNFKTKHIKGRSKEESGQIIQVEAPIHSSNVMLYSKEKKVASRVGHKVLEDGRKVRYLIKTGETIDNKDDWKKIHKKNKKEDK